MSELSFDDLAAYASKPGGPVLGITSEQRAILSAPVDSPALVTAGAGSGKTHTMMLRMLWLIANHGIPPSEVVGLTFTRKAAGELHERVGGALQRLREHRPGLVNDFDEPQVSTYNAFAAGIYKQYALLIGREPNAVLLDDANAFALMRRVVLDSRDSRLSELQDISLRGLTSRTLNLARQMRENGVSAHDVDEYVAQFLGTLQQLGGEDYAGFTKGLRETLLHIERWEILPTLAQLGDEYQRRKEELGYLEFTDQVAYAGEIVALDERIAAEVRAGTSQVILDEYQDTSVGQTRLFAALFRDRAVMAVGDPKQSIYTWRGASAANMRRFATDFASSGHVHEYTLSTSWRNDRAVLEAANCLAASLPTRERGTKLTPAPTAQDGEVRVHYYLTEPQEAEEVAIWFQQKLRREPTATAAILVRARAKMDVFAEALAARGVPHQVLGIGGLLSAPEIVDLTALLRAAADEYAGNELLRLLLGARFELGIADVHALSDLAAQLAREAAMTPTEPPSDAAQAEIAGDLRGAFARASLSEALEWLRTASDQDRAARCPGLSEAGAQRAINAARLLQQLRAQLALPLVDWVSLAIRLSRLDIETTANPDLAGQTANLELFLSAVANYAAAVPGAEIGDFLDWLTESESDDRLAAYAPTPPSQGVVQLTTIHSAKGLEWDYVAIGTLAKGKFPDLTGSGVLLEPAMLPNELRQDAADLPRIRPEGLLSKDDLANEFRRTLDTDEGFTDHPGVLSFREQRALQALREDRRLLYVAVTRARHGLLLTSSRWRPGRARPLEPSMFQLELCPEGELPPDCRVGDELWLDPDSNPLAWTDERVRWPAAPMPEGKLARVRALAEQVTERADAGDTASSYDELIDLLLAERAEQRRPRPLTLPTRFGASGLHDLLDDPVAAARNAARAMPQRPYRATMLGNAFHGWVEERYADVAGHGSTLELSDGDDPDFGDAGSVRLSSADAARLDAMQATFLRSRFTANGRKPVAVELPIQLPLGEYTLINKIDAVYRNDDGTIEIVDWKTGRAPRTSEERHGRQLQLRCYAHAYATSYNVPLEQIRATLYYVAEDTELTVDDLGTAEELLELLREAARTAEGAAARTADGGGAGA